MRELKFRVWDKIDKEWHYYDMLMEMNACNYYDNFGSYEYHSIFTGLKDKNGKEGYFDSDIWEIKNYEYRVVSGIGWIRKTIDLKFILKRGLLKVEYEIINKPESLQTISLDTIFNLPLESGKRLYTDDNRQKLEIIGNKQENPELPK